MAWRMVEYLCRYCGLRFEELVQTPPAKTSACKRAFGCLPDRLAQDGEQRCRGVAELVISAPMYQHVTGKNSVTVTRGKSDEPPPGALQTCPPEWK